MSTIHPEKGPLATSISAGPRFAVSLGPTAYLIAWTGVLAVHGICGAYCFAGAKLFAVLQESKLTQRLFMYGMILSPTYFPIMSGFLYTLGAVHAYLMVAPPIMWVFCWARGRFSPSPASTESRLLSRLASNGETAVRLASRLPGAFIARFPSRLRSSVLLSYTAIFAPKGLLGIEGKYFDGVLFVREAFETAYQTFQAYQMCRLLSRPWLNRMFVCLLVANAWVTPILHRLPLSKPAQRALDRLFDVALDFASTIGVSVAIVATYAPLYDDKIQNFAQALWDDLIWSSRAYSEASLVFFVSWIDVFGRMVLSIGLLLSLDDVKMLLKRRVPTTEHLGQAKTPHRATRGRIALKLGHTLMFLYGFGIAAVHLHSELRPWLSSCQLEMRPWFARDTFCAVVHFNCTPSSKENPVDDLLDRLDGSALRHLKLRHCSLLTIPPSIQKFHNIGSFTTYNTSVAKWDTAAALTGTHHPYLFLVTFIRTSFTDGLLPDGLLSHDGPRGLMGAQFSITNLKSIPDDLDEYWPNGMLVTIEFSQLTRFPVAFTRMGTLGMSFRANLITEAPAAAFETTAIMINGAPAPYFIFLDGNPISFLPETVNMTATANLLIVSLEWTSLVALPAWIPAMVSSGRHLIDASKTPYCDQRIPKMMLGIIEDPMVLAHVLCAEVGPPVPVVHEI